MRKADEIEHVKPEHFEIDRKCPEKLEKAVMAMGCFWGVEAVFGGLEGVWRTKVGYTGGDKEEPTYRSLGKHTETVMVEFDQEEITYEELLEVFFESHSHEKEKKPQYASKIFFIDEDQEKKAEEIRPEKSATKIEPIEVFWLAEDYHQKYRLRGTREAEKILQHYNNEEFIQSTLASKLNSRKAGKLKHEINSSVLEKT